MAPLLAEARDDEQRVVDPDGEPDHRGDVLREQVQVVAGRGQRRCRHREHDRPDREEHWQEGGHDRTEHDDQDREGDGRAEQLAALEVLLPLLGEVDGEGRLAGDENLELARRVEHIDRLVDAVDHFLGVVHRARHRDGYEDAAAVHRDERVVARLVEGDGTGDDLRPQRDDLGVQLFHRGPERGVVHGQRRRADEDRLGHGLLARQPLVDEVLRLDGAGAVRLTELGGERVAEAGGEDRDGDGEHHPSDRERAPGMQRADAGEILG